VAREEDESQQVVTDFVVDRVVELRPGIFLAKLDHGTDFLELTLLQLLATKEIDRAPLRDGHKPSTGVCWYARLGPPLECCNERVLREIFGNAKRREPCALGRRSAAATRSAKPHRSRGSCRLTLRG